MLRQAKVIKRDGFLEETKGEFEGNWVLTFAGLTPATKYGVEAELEIHFTFEIFERPNKVYHQPGVNDRNAKHKIIQFIID